MTDSIQKEFSDSSFQDLKDPEKIRKQLLAWKETSVKFGVIGSSGVGKSTFINTFRGLNAKHAKQPGYAKTGNSETTTIVKEYPFPKHNNMKLYDLPGAGTELFPVSKYPDLVEMDQYDVFIFLSGTRFSEADSEIWREIKNRGKPCFFARTRADEIAENVDEKLEPEDNFEQKWEEEQACLTKIMQEKLGDDSQNIFFISKKKNIALESGRLLTFPDNQHLEEAILQQLPDLQKQALLTAVAPATEKIIEEKVSMLENRVYLASALSASIGAVPIPGVSLATNSSILSYERSIQKETLGIDGETLKKKAGLFNHEYGDFIEMLAEMSAAHSDDAPITEVLLDLLKDDGIPWTDMLSNASSVLELATDFAAEEMATFVPVVGSVCGAVYSGQSTGRKLQAMLGHHAIIAKKLLELEQKLTIDSL